MLIVDDLYKGTPSVERTRAIWWTSEKNLPGAHKGRKAAPSQTSQRFSFFSLGLIILLQFPKKNRYISITSMH
jgi:hypothetical protein